MGRNNSHPHPTKDTAMKTLPLLIHTVKGKTTLCGMDTSQGAPITRAQLTGRQWRTCPLCELAKTCAQIDANRNTTQAQALADHEAPEPDNEPPPGRARARWIQPPLFD